MAGDKAQRRAAIALLAAYHEARLADLIEHVRDGLARYDAGELDAFGLDAVMHRYQRAARELWKFCSASGAHAVSVARLLEESTAAGRSAGLVGAGQAARALRSSGAPRSNSLTVRAAGRDRNLR